ncbi:MAG: TonB-dependent receptor, partial [Bacteroidetes bacterium]
QNHQYNFFNPKAGVTWRLADENVLFASVAVANREPSRSDFRDADPGTVVLSERLTDYELGYRHGGKRVALNANLFYMDYKNQLVLTGKINNVGSAIRTNVANSYRTGVELSAALLVTDWFKWDMNLAYSQNKIKNFTEYVDNWDYWNDPSTEPLQYEKNLGTTDISFSPNVVGSSNMVFTMVKNLHLNLVSNYVGRQYIDNTSNKERSLDPYFINNIRLSYTWFPGFVKSVDFIVNMNNIFDNHYETNAWVYRYVYGEEEYEMNGYFSQAGFNVMGGVVVKF